MPLRGLVEKPPPDAAPSRLGVVGRYILGPSIFAHIDRLEVGTRGEYQITDALASQLRAGEPLAAFLYEGRRFDTGRPLGYLIAGLAAGLDRHELAQELRAGVSTLLAQEAGP
jgi:UTP--glucose-1-phosphate uridylyltransferase